MSKTEDICELPFKAEKLSFAAHWAFADPTSEDNPPLDLSVVCLDREGKVVDAADCAYVNALDGAIRHSRDPRFTDDEPLEANEAVHVLTNRLPPETEVMVFVLSAAMSPVRVSDLTSPSALTFSIHSTEKEVPRRLMNTIDLKPLFEEPTAAATALSSGHQSCVLCALYRVPGGWAAHILLQSFPQDNWGELLPDIKAAVKTLPDLYAAQAAVVDPLEKVVLSRRGMDRTIEDLANGRAEEKTAVKQLRIDVGWSVFGKTPEEELEETGIEWAVIFYNAQGEEVMNINPSSTEGDGIEVGKEEPPEEEEGEGEEAAEEEPAEEEAEQEGEAAEGAEGEEGAPPPPPPEEVEPKPDRKEFPLKESIFVTLDELPKDVRTALVVITNYAGSGFMHIRTAQVKISDITAGRANPRPMLQYRQDGLKGLLQDRTTALLCKLYKEFEGTSFGVWAASSTPSLEVFLRKSNVKALMQRLLEEHKELKGREDVEKKRLEEEGEDEPAVDLRGSCWRMQCLGHLFAGESLEALAPTIANVNMFDGSLTQDGKRHDSVSRVSYPNGDSYVGRYTSDFKAGLGLYRFANGSVYLGSYDGGKRSGHGFLILPDSGFYEGSFLADRFHGMGKYEYPDGSCYMGSWEKGAKHGEGVYWDTLGGCMRGMWQKGVVKGHASYDQPAYHFEGNFVRGVPAGPGSFTLCSHRMLDLPKLSADDILGDYGPTLRGEGQYAIPPGADYEPPEVPEGEEPTADDSERPAIPEHPKYEGLSFASTSSNPAARPDITFPPAMPELPTGVKLAQFTVAKGVLLAA